MLFISLVAMAMRCKFVGVSHNIAANLFCSYQFCSQVSWLFPVYCKQSNDGGLGTRIYQECIITGSLSKSVTLIKARSLGKIIELY